MGVAVVLVVGVVVYQVSYFVRFLGYSQSTGVRITVVLIVLVVVVVC